MKFLTVILTSSRSVNQSRTNPSMAMYNSTIPIPGRSKSNGFSTYRSSVLFAQMLHVIIKDILVNAITRKQNFELLHFDL